MSCRQTYEELYRPILKLWRLGKTSRHSLATNGFAGLSPLKLPRSGRNMSIGSSRNLKKGCAAPAVGMAALTERIRRRVPRKNSYSVEELNEMKVLQERKYNSAILCATSLTYFAAGLLALSKNSHLAVLLFAVTIFSIAYHSNFKNFYFKSLDWILGFILTFYIFYSMVTIRFNSYMLAFLLLLAAFRLVDHILFKTKRYGIFSYTHALWHLVSGLTIIGLIVLIY
jgi:hypothetical protein